MRTRTTTTITGIAAVLLSLTACSSSKDNDADAPAPTKTTAAGAAKVDCSDPSLSQADWTKNCDKGGGGLSKKFGQTFAWPDGVKVTVTKAVVFTDYDKSSGEKRTAGSTDYQVFVKVTNGSHAPLDLGNISVITEGATSGGEAGITGWTNAAPGLEGRLAPGVSVTKADQETLGTKFGRKIVVTVQRMSPTSSDPMEFPEFSGSITG